ncbi:MAG: hypothetical protein HFACDABA_01186 [Anaerolineales bacterium]|nr:hypothetical protein [Anaerolineales bacterium]
MRLAFPHLDQVEENSTVDKLALLQLRLLDKKLTALIEIGLEPPQRLTLFYAHGGQAGAFLSDGETFQPVSVTDIFSKWTGGARPLRLLLLPDKAARAAWMAATSTSRARRNGRGPADFTQLNAAWKREATTGLVEVITERAQGFLYFQNGALLESESIWIRENGPASQTDASDLAGSWEAFILETPPNNAASQCFTLRQAARAWSGAIFDSYSNIAGEKFLQVMLRELRVQIAPWQWNFQVETGGLMDDHFFPNTAALGHAYRALFMGIGAQMEFAIGANLTQRMMNEMFNELAQEERASLESQRLIPAAFS